MSLKTVKNTTLDAVFVELRRMGFNDTHEKDIIEWSGQALEQIGCINQYEEAVCFIIVKNHKMTLPTGLKSIIQIARNNCYIPKISQSLLTAQAVVSQIQQPYTLLPPTPYIPDPGCEYCGISQDPSQYGYMNENLQYVTPSLGGGLPGNINTTAFDINTYVPIPIDCFGEPIDEMSLAYYRPYFDLQYEYSPWTNSPIYRKCFSPVRLTNHSFFDTLVAKEDNYDMLYEQGVREEYNIYGGDTVKFSFCDGQIALAYTRIALDAETGWPKIPDEVSYITACVYYIIWKLMNKDFYQGRDGSEKRLAQANSEWVHYCNQAGNKALMLSGEDEYQNFMDERSYLLPRMNRYSNFFGKLGTPENRKYNNPDFKNSRLSLFRGYSDL